MVQRSIAWLAVSLLAAYAGVGCGGEQVSPPQVSEPQEVTFVSSDSAYLVGTWQEVPNARVAVICIPTVDFTRSTWSNTANLLTSSGWSVLVFDLRGQGDSRMPDKSRWAWSPADTATGIGYYMKDIRGAISFVRGKMGNTVKIVLVGADLGGVSGLYAATAEPRVAGVALISPPGGLSNLIAGGLVSRYGDRPLLIMTEQPMEATLGTPRTMDSWLGRGSAMTLRLTEPQKTTTLQNKQAAHNMLARWIASVTL